jgi:penicillin-binding protein 2
MTEQQRKRRLLFVVGIFLTILLLFCSQLFYLQVIRGEAYLAQSVRKIAKTESIEAARGEILDRNGLPLVSNRVSWQISLDLSQMGEARNETLLTLMKLCASSQITWYDTLPISTDAPFRYTKESTNETNLKRYEDYLHALKLKESESALTLLNTLAKRYDIPAELSPQVRRSLIGILYELDLRKKEVTWSEYVFANDVSMEFITSVKEHSLPGVTITPLAERSYKTSAAAHILGRVGQMDQEEWTSYQDLGYAMDERVGKNGIERAFESYLHGEKGVRTQEVDTQGKVVGETYLTEPTPGENVSLTLDLGLQEKTEQVLADKLPTLGKAEGAAVAILDVRDGGVLTLASYPSFDLSQFSSKYNSFQEDPMRPLYNRALQGTYAPGSTYKMVTAVAGLEEGVITPETKILCTGRYTYYSHPQPYCWIYRETGKTHGVEMVSEAITDSCNIFFYDVGRRLGIDRLDRYARLFGLGEPTGIELMGEAAGVIAGPSYTESLGQTWYDGNTLSAAIGQENNRFTPLQLANCVSTLVNGGQRLRVHLLKEVQSNDKAKSILQTKPELLDTVSIEPNNLAAVKEGMLAVTESGSVAAYFQNLNVKVGAKTGSAQVTGNEESNAVFVCFAPYDNPEIAMSIVVEKGGSGSELGSIAAEILSYYFQGDPEQTAETPEG